MSARVAVTIVAAALVLVAGALAASVVLERKLRDAGRGDLGTTVEDIPFMVIALSATIVGAAIAVRRPRHPVGWLFLAFGLSIIALGITEPYARYGAVARPGSLPGAELLAVVNDRIFIVWFVLVSLVLYLTPTGRPLSPRLAKVVAATAVSGGVAFAVSLLSTRSLEPPLESVANPLGLDAASGAVNVVAFVALLATTAGLIGGAVSLVVRFLRATGVERQQLLWLAVVAVPLPALVAASFVASPEHPLVVSLLFAGFAGLLPVAAGLAISQYHLYDVDRILSRGLTYAAVSALVAATYAVVVVAVGQTLGSAGGRSVIAAVVATLAAVSVAAPAYRRIQDAIDRRFNRRRFDALRVVRNYVRAPEPGTTIEDVLRRALGDPDLRVVFWVDERSQWVTADGMPAAPGPDDISVHRHGRNVASVCFDPTRIERDMVEKAVDEATPELDNAGLRAAITLQLVEVGESRARIAAAQLAERRKIERNLHDGAQQRLLALALQLRAAHINGEPGRLRDTVGAGIDELQRAVMELRELANGLHPAVLSDGGLVAALDDLAARTPINVDVHAPERRFAPDVDAAAWFVSCEAVANAVKHSGASRIGIDVAQENGCLTVVVTDDGSGLADPTGRGLRGIADRAEAAGGRLSIESRPGRGTTVRAELPCES